MNTDLNLAGGAGLVLERLEAWNRLRKDTASYLRLLYLEVLSSLDLINALKASVLKGIPPNDPAFRKFTGMLKTEMAEAVFCSDDEGQELYERFKKKGKVNNLGKRLRQVKNGKETRVSGNFIYENVLQALSFYVQKTGFLKQISQLDDTEIALIHPLMLETRLINIRQRLLMIKTVMESFPEISDMAR